MCLRMIWRTYLAVLRCRMNVLIHGYTDDYAYTLITNEERRPVLKDGGSRCIDLQEGILFVSRDLVFLNVSYLESRFFSLSFLRLNIPLHLHSFGN